jgi:hypothetical protein
VRTLFSARDNSTLIFYCHFARFLWRAVQVTFNIAMPTSVVDLFNDWAYGVGIRFKKLLLVGATALCWTMWTSRNEMVFDKSPAKTYMQVFYRGTYGFSNGCNFKGMRSS